MPPRARRTILWGMTPQELRAAGERLFGHRGWQVRLAEVLGINSSTIRRWLMGKMPVSGPAQAAIRLLLERSEVDG